ncbi:MAG: LytTR family transcriptional regulator DNA-binding domain-containing protein, partial [Cyclobacteriaceae bacterium]|nr:LytTR family transcriptional regulator DNA-binding domain-containing protein [Cyclobacteriaceae bacterium]
IGMFLFYLFFQPLDLKNADFNNKLVIIAGFGFITFFILGLTLIFLPFIFPKFFQTGKWNLIRDIILNALIWILISTAYTFYARYVGLIEITIHSMFKLLLLGLAPVAILIVANQNKILKRYLQNALELTKKLDQEGEERSDPEAEITIESENRSESVKVNLNNLMLVKSANNYIEVFWKKDDEIHKTLLRNTLTKIENQLKSYPNFIRCHRTALVNKSFILKLTGGSQGHQIRLEGLDELIPVSRQYALKVKEQINS